MTTTVTTDVLIVGAGPCGMVLANLLGLYGIDALVVDREAAIIEFPRAVGIDDEALRTCQTVGLVDQVLADTLQDMPIRYYTSWGRCLAEVHPRARPFGWARRNLFLQPLLERTMRLGVERFDSVDVRLTHELVSLTRHDSGVTGTLRGPAGEVVVDARWLVGADGGRSTVRDLIGVSLDGTTLPVKWLVVDVENDQMDAPYSAVYCDSDSPTLMVPLPYGRRRFEFRLRRGDDEESIVETQRVRSLLATRYGSGALPEVTRARVYLHHSRVASTFRAGNVFLVGDAAHLQPPFFGQGMNSGLRDVTNLAWKLAMVRRGLADDRLLDTYDAERRPHAAEMVRFATRMGAMYRPRNRLTERVRTLVFRAAQRIPGGRDYILQMKYKPMPRYTEGVVAGVMPKQRNDPVGRMFPQPWVEREGTRMLLDEALGPWFAILVVGGSAAELDGEAIAWWESRGARIVSVHSSGAVGAPITSPTVVVDDVDGLLATWRSEYPGIDVVVLRPDRYVAAACRAEAFPAITASLRASMSTGTAGPGSVADPR